MNFMDMCKNKARIKKYHIISWAIYYYLGHSQSHSHYYWLGSIFSRFLSSLKTPWATLMLNHRLLLHDPNAPHALHDRLVLIFLYHSIAIHIVLHHQNFMHIDHR